MIEDPWISARDGADALEEGYFILRKRRAGRVDVPIRIWFGPPKDPVDGSILDRSPRWQIEINGVVAGDPDMPACIGGFPVDSLDGIWPECKAEPTTKEDYDFRVARADYAAAYDARDPFGGTAARIDPMTATLPRGAG